MKFIIPANLDLEQLLLANQTITIYSRGENKTLKTKNLVKHLSYCHYLIDLIIGRNDHADEHSGYINLKTEEITKYIPSHTKQMIVSLLETLNVILVNHTYSVGNFSKSYKLSPVYCATGFKEVDQSGKMIEKIEKVFASKTNDLLSNPNYPEYSFQKDNLLNINFDTSGALNYINSLPNIEKEKYDYMILKINEISNGEVNINLNNKVNRFFSCITNLNKDLRYFIKDNNQNSLISIDFTSSHTFHLIHILKSGKHSSLVKKEVIGNPLCLPLLEVEVENLLKIMNTQGVYEFIIDEYKTTFNESITREKAKELWITYFLYGMYPKRYTSKWIKSLFPEISKYIDSSGRKETSKKLMLSESKLLNTLIVRRIAKDSPRAIIYGLFDSVLVDQENFDEVYNIMLEETYNYFGFNAPLKVELPKSFNVAA